MDPRPRALHLVALLAPAVATLATAACGDDGPQRSAASFCGAVTTNQAALLDPPLRTELDITATLGLYREVGRAAPLAIQREWDAIVLNLETASTVVPTDPESVQRAVARAYATEQSAVAVHDWLRDNCSIEFGPIGTIVPSG